MNTFPRDRQRGTGTVERSTVASTSTVRLGFLMVAVATLAMLLAAACGGNTGGEPNGPDVPSGGTVSDTPAGNETAFTMYASPT